MTVRVGHQFVGLDEMALLEGADEMGPRYVVQTNKQNSTKQHKQKHGHTHKQKDITVEEILHQVIQSCPMKSEFSMQPFFIILPSTTRMDRICRD